MERYWEIDSLRGIAIILMLASNFATDLDFFGFGDFASGAWWWFARGVASTFLLLVGISLVISFSRPGKKFRKYLVRGLKIFVWGLAITAITYFAIGKGFVLFGILHLIGISIILSFPLIIKKIRALSLGIAAVLFGIYLNKVLVSTNVFAWLGLHTVYFESIDYFPIFPWLGVVLVGIFLGNILYKSGERQFIVKERNPKLLTWLGRNSLKIYLIHQPVFVGAIWLYLQLA